MVTAVFHTTANPPINDFYEKKKYTYNIIFMEQLLHLKTTLCVEDLFVCDCHEK